MATMTFERHDERALQRLDVDAAIVMAAQRDLRAFAPLYEKYFDGVYGYCLRSLRDSEAGLDTQVGERGDNLSGGQRQAIAIARALLYDPPILLLDEPTASIDPGSERRLYTHLKQMIRGKTILLVTHKSAVLGLVDKLILMDRGRIVAAVPRDEVIQKLQAGAYRAAGSGGAPNE